MDRDCTTIDITDDELLEGDEMFVVTLQSSNPRVNAGPPDRAVVTIQDDDGKNQRVSRHQFIMLVLNRCENRV